MNRTAILTLSMFLVSLVATPAAACPFCATETGKEVRDRIFDAHFYCNAMYTLLPLLLLLVIVTLIYLDWLWPRAPKTDDQQLSTAHLPPEVRRCVK